MSQLPVAIYCRVSTDDQDTARQERDLKALAEARGYKDVLVFHETASGAKNSRPVRKEVMDLAKAGKIKLILVTELTRWGRNTVDLIETLEKLADYGVKVEPQNGEAFDTTSAHGKLILGVMATVAQFERDLLRERIKSGIAARAAAGKYIGRKTGAKNKTDKHAGPVISLVTSGLSVRQVAEKLDISPTTVQAIKKRHFTG